MSITTINSQQYLENKQPNFILTYFAIQGTLNTYFKINKLLIFGIAKNLIYKINKYVNNKQ